MREAMQAYRELLPSGSRYVLSHISPADVDEIEQDQLKNLEKVSKQSSTPGVLRSRDELMAFFGTLELLDPELVPVEQWQPDPTDDPDVTVRAALGGVALKR